MGRYSSLGFNPKFDDNKQEDIIYVGVIHALLVWLPLYIKARML